MVNEKEFSCAFLYFSLLLISTPFVKICSFNLVPNLLGWVLPQEAWEWDYITMKQSSFLRRRLNEKTT